MKSIISLIFFIISFQSLAAPIGSMLLDSNSGSLVFMISPSAIEHMMKSAQRKKGFLLSPADQKKATSALAAALMEETKRNDYLLSPCYLDQSGISRLQVVYQDALLLNYAGLKTRFTKVLAELNTECTKEAIRLLETPAQVDEESIWTVEDTFVDGLKYVASGTSKESVILEFENGKKFRLLGNIFSLTYQDLAQTSKDGKSYAGAITEDGADLSLIYDANEKLSLSATAYLYQYGESHFKADKGKEVSFKLTYKIKDYFRVGVSYHLGKLGDGEDNQYGIGRIIGVYVPKAWR